MRRTQSIFLVTVGFVASGLYSSTPMAQDDAPAIGEMFQDCPACPAMVWVPGGRFVMGSPAGERGRDDDEGPRHAVTIARPLAVGIHEVTWDEWDACVGDDGCPALEGDGMAADQQWGRGTRPVINVSWHDARRYTAWLRQLTGSGYRLMSEAEWEYVVRAGSTARFPFGDDAAALCAHANGADLATDFNNRNDCFDGMGRTTAPAGSYEPNAFGVHDMIGNVWEWTQDCWNARFDAAPGDGAAWTDGDCTQRVVRGGSWGSYPHNLRSAARYGVAAGYRGHEVGFRVVTVP